MCVSLHNTIVEDEENEGLESCFDVTTIHIGQRIFFVEFKNVIQEIKNVDMHFKLRNDMINYLWTLKRNNEFTL
jgi:hypothetical protein